MARVGFGGLIDDPAAAVSVPPTFDFNTVCGVANSIYRGTNRHGEIYAIVRDIGCASDGVEGADAILVADGVSGDDVTSKGGIYISDGCVVVDNAGGDDDDRGAHACGDEFAQGGLGCDEVCRITVGCDGTATPREYRRWRCVIMHDMLRNCIYSGCCWYIVVFYASRFYANRFYANGIAGDDGELATTDFFYEV